MDQQSILSARHAYVHVPFCTGKCAYCAFHSDLYDCDAADKYLDDIEKELDDRLRAGRLKLTTIYIGGGTPSVLDENQLARLLRLVCTHAELDGLQEWTVEANPGTLYGEKLALLKDTGVNRISLGVQSFDDEVLKLLGRRHKASDVPDTIRAVRAAGIDNIGIDLIANLPEVGIDEWGKCLRKAVELDPSHVSIYDLSIEPDTMFHRHVTTRKLVMPEEDVQLEHLRKAEEVLSGAGYVRYEISNYAKPGYESRHNVACWLGRDYVGFGPSSCSRLGLARRTNPTSDIVTAVQILSQEDDLVERFIYRFRLLGGVCLEEFYKEHTELSRDLADYWQHTLVELENEGLVESSDSIWRLTERGVELADHVARELIP